MTEYTSAIATAKRLIELKGLPLILRKNVNTTPVDGAQPWDGVGNTPSDTAVTGVFLNYAQKYIDGTVIKQGDIKLLLAADSLGAIVPEQQDKVIDGTNVWQIKNIFPLKPGPEAIMYTLQLRK